MKKYLKKYTEYKEYVIREKDFSIVTEEEILSAKQCYTEDESELFYTARQQFPQYLFITYNGKLLSFYRKKVKVLTADIKNRKKYPREYYNISTLSVPELKEKNIKKITIDVGALTKIVYGTEKCSNKAKKLLDEHGLLALRKPNKKSKPLVECHHNYKYIHENLIENRLKNMESVTFLAYEEHLVLSNMLKIDAKEKQKKRFRELEARYNDNLPNNYIMIAGEDEEIFSDAEGFEILDAEKGLVSIMGKKLILESITGVEEFINH